MAVASRRPLQGAPGAALRSGRARTTSRSGHQREITSASVTFAAHALSNPGSGADGSARAGSQSPAPPSADSEIPRRAPSAASAVPSQESDVDLLEKFSCFDLKRRNVSGVKWKDVTPEDVDSWKSLGEAVAKDADVSAVVAKGEVCRCDVELGQYTWEISAHMIPCPGAQRVALCMHGHGSNCQYALWMKFWPMLAELGFHVLSFDSPGFGRSSGVTCQTAKWKPHDQDLVLALLQGWSVPIDAGCVTVFGQCMGGAMFLRCFQKQPACFAAYHVLHNCTIGTWPDQLATILKSKGGGLLAFWEADDDHMREANVYRELSKLQKESPNLCTFHDLGATPESLPRFSSGFVARGLSRNGGEVGSDQIGSGQCIYVLEPPPAYMETVAKFITKMPRRNNLLSTGPKGTALERGVINTDFKVFIRMRPPIAREMDEEIALHTAPLEKWEPPKDWEGPPPEQLTAGSNKGGWIFDRVFGPGSTQDNVYETACKPLVSAVVAGRSACMLAYGQTGSGKTFTMEGPNKNGMIQQGVQELYRQLAGEVIKATYVQLYNDTLLDLFKPEQDKLKLADDPKGGAAVEGAIQHSPSSGGELLAFVEKGSKVRATGQTNMNDASSRSHAILTLHVGEGDAGRVFHFVDLAGSERVARSGATGDRLGEAIAINSALLALGNVVSALVEIDGKARAHIPYRDSMLTRILQTSLGGSARTSLVACVTPTADSLSESISTVHFAARATYIKNNNKGSDDELTEAQVATIEKRKANIEVNSEGVAVIPACGIDISCCASLKGSQTLAIMLHHYNFGGSCWMWHSLGSQFAEAGIDYIAPSMPGHGDTPGESSSKMEDFLKPGGPVDIVKALVDAAGYRKIIIVGFDWGGGIAAEFAIKYPKRVSHLVLWCMSYRDEAKLQKLSKKGEAKQILFLWDKSDVNRSYKKGQAFAKAMKTKYIEYDWDLIPKRVIEWAKP